MGKNKPHTHRPRSNSSHRKSPGSSKGDSGRDSRESNVDQNNKESLGSNNREGHGSRWDQTKKSHKWSSGQNRPSREHIGQPRDRSEFYNDGYNINPNHGYSQNKTSQHYPSYPYYYPPYCQGEYMPPPMWPPYYHPQFNYQHSNEGNSNGNNYNSYQNGTGGFHQFYSMPPPLLPSFGMFRNNQTNKTSPRQTKTNGESVEEEEEPAPPGSEAAREKERADIAKRLMEMDKKPPESKTETSPKPSPIIKSPQSSSRPTKKTANKTKNQEKTQKRPAMGQVSDVPSKKANTSELNANILSKIAAMGQEEIKGIVNNPQSAKSQEILKALMNHYRELKGVELDKRRLLAPTSSNSSGSYNAVFSNVDAIEIADLPQEIITQLNNFLGCNLLGLQSGPQTFEEIVLESDSAEGQENGEQFMGPTDQFQPELRVQDPEKILEELVMIDLRIQADMHRKMDLYQQLHQLMVGRVIEQPDAGDVEAPNNQPSPNQLKEKKQPLLPAPTMSSTSGLQSLPTPQILPSQLLPTPITLPALPNLTGSSKENHKSKNTHVGEKKNKQRVSEKKTAPEIPKAKEKKKSESVSIISDFNIIGIEEQGPPRVEINLRSYKFEIYDMKVVDSNTVVLACSDHNVYGFGIGTSKKTHEFKGHVDKVTCVMPVNLWRGVIQEQIICSGGLDEHICIFGLKSQQCVSKYYVASPVLCLEYFHDLVTNIKLLYAGLKNGMIQMYNVEKFIPKGSLDCGNKAITAILATKEGPLNVLIVAAEDKTICLRDANSGLYLRQFEYNFIATKFILHGNVFFCQSTAHGVTSFDLNTGDYLGFLKTNCPVSRIARLKNVLFVVLSSGLIRVYDMNTKQLMSEIGSKGKLLRYIDIAEDKMIVAAARVNDLIMIPFSLKLSSQS